MKSKSQNRKREGQKGKPNESEEEPEEESRVTQGHRLSKMAKIRSEKRIRNRSRKQKTKPKETERIRKRKAMKTGARQSFRSFYSNCVKIFRNVSGSLVASKTNRMNVASLPQKRKHPVIMPCKKSFMKWRRDA